MNRVVLINRRCSPSREELQTSERRMGELLFAQFPDLSWAGWVIAEDNGKRSANWIIPQETLEAFCHYIKTFESSDYEVAVYTNGQTRHGGQCEVRIA